MEPDALTLGTLSADMIPTADDFFDANDEADLDRPTEGFASIPEALEDIRRGKVRDLHAWA